MDKTKNVQETSSLLPEFSAYELKKITDLAENYARKFSLPLNIQFVDEKNGAIAWVVDDTLQGQGNANEGKTIYINTPEFQKLVFERTGEKLKADELLQVALHEIGHLKENAELKYWGEKLQNSGDFAKNFQHELTPFVVKNFEAIKGASLQQKRENLVFNPSGPRFHNFENTVRDIFVNHKSVGLESGIFALKSTVEGSYLRWAFPGEDWTQANEAGGMMPDFAQFSKGMLRNVMTPHHPVKLAPEVEKKLKRRNETGYAQWKGKERSIIEMASDEDIPFPVRLPYIFFLYEEMKKFWDGDLQQQEQNSQAQDWTSPSWTPQTWEQQTWKNQNWKQQDWEQQTWEQQDWEQQTWENQTWENQTWEQQNWEQQTWEQQTWENQTWEQQNWEQQDWENQTWEQQNWEQQTWEQQTWENQTWEQQNWEQQDWENQTWEQQTWEQQDWEQQTWENQTWEDNASQRKQGNTSQSSLASQKTSKPLNEEDLKKRDQEQGMPHCLEDALTPQNLEALEKALQEQIARDIKEEQKTPEQREREQRLRNTSYADLEHSNPEEREQKLKLLEKTDKMMQAVHQEYGEVMQELEEKVFSKIISKRQLRTRENRWPVVMEKGNHTLHPRGAMSLYRDQVMGRDLTKTQARGRDIIRKEVEKLAKGFHLTLICDGSGSMEWSKNKLQKLNTLLMLQTLKNLQDELDMAPDLDPDKKTEIFSQAMIFYDHQLEEFKASSNNLTDEDLMQAMEALDIVSGSTPLHLALQKLKSDFEALEPELQRKIQQHEEIAVALILSDGKSNDPGQDKLLIEDLREKGFIMCGIGITAKGSPILELFGEEDEGQGFGVVCQNPHDLPEQMQTLLAHVLSYL